ncbi:putative nitroreductase family protein [Phaeomoniella chlamydospora]|uniref:Putative nitroreductase family protein n=1 Tax=Phaeomoniella chlamydospora TaxID=158046 RepID=A0A0G2E668_PHACM|nr:putative nitroreductase family protein [Phaeomoniella chlamydospora]
MASYQKFLDEIKERRSVYTLSPETTISDEEIKKILETALEECPSTFGSYTTRLVLLVKEEHYKLWDIATEVIKGVTPEEQWEKSTKGRLAMFRNAYGSVLYFEDPENTRLLEDKYPFIKDNFAPWAEHASAMHQFVVWTAFANAGLGANLQHYSPLIDDKVKAAYNIPATWKLVAQMPFGKPTAPAGPKATGLKKPLAERLIVHGA